MADNITPINPMNIGYQDQAVQASGGAILTGADRKIIKERLGADIDTSTKFTDLVKEMFNKTDSIEEVQTGEQHEAGTKDDQKTRIKLEKRLIRYAPYLDQPKDRVEIVAADREPGLKDSYVAKVEKPFDEYAVLYGQKLIGLQIPEDTYKYLEETLAPEVIRGIRYLVEQNLTQLLAVVIKESFYEKVRDPKLASNIILKTKNAQYLLDYYSIRNNLPIPVLLELLKELGISINMIKEMYNLETVTLTADELKIKALEQKRKDEIKVLEESLKDQYMQMLLSESVVDRYKIYAGVSLTKAKLQSFKVPAQRILALIAEAKRVAWLKTVVIVKDLHLKRVFSTSKQEFEQLSKRIKDYTLRARKLGLRISREGVLWVEAQVENMALEAAEYKIKLLGSMQEMGFDKAREKDILWLTAIINHLKKSASTA